VAFIFDITNADSFAHVTAWLEVVQKYGNSSGHMPLLVLLANKSMP
jgi:hypothetical protein